MLAQRRSRPQPEQAVAGRGFFDTDSDDDYWPGGRIATDSRADSDHDFWSPPAEESAGFDADEDAIDTAPTRVPSEADFTEAGYTAPATEDRFTETPISAGRHSTSTLAASPAAWRLELDETIGAPRRRHAVAESWFEEFDAVIEEPVEPEYQPEYQRAQDPPVEEPVEESWRPAIHLPLADPFQAPEGYWIKGNTHSGLYYTPESVLYDNTIPEVWFASEDVAQANGFVRAPE
jgi:uncharacterized protein with LGFP repeats